MGELTEGFECPKGQAWMGMKVRATDANESTDMIKVIGNDIGFSVDGEIQVYETEPEQPPRGGSFWL